jgi:hypothetical protein
MLRTCPRCGDYFAGDAPPFCPSDGTPLAGADPRDLDEGERVVKEKARLLRRRVRRLKLRRVMTAMVTVIVMTMVVYVVVGNYVVYVEPDPEEKTLLAAVTPTPSPTSPTPVPIPTPSPDITPSPSITPTPTPACTDKDRRDAAKLILGQNRGRWDEANAPEKQEVIERNVPTVLTARGVRERGSGTATPTYHVTVTKDCQAATVTYSWHVTWEADLVRQRGEKTVGGAKTFRCSKKRGAWRCT